ncbi:ABC transporter ATP-binding protein [Ruminococcus gauvreauii]|uniref:ABC transporter ATP-binding protein n=1 Tax=Ruminococcus gauvreauii TaxID=438033 RepID=A0ABY5VFK4_9FIRM|nr:ABC transporter ATP-binding protein [Ruminococcus gauvreauii]UWP58263.1 ABC transporter ATP-binding protein [Ruminococcus gauvreauii]
MQPVLQVSNLSVSFDTPRGEVEAVRDVSWQLDAGEVLAVVGESGCGKTVMVQSIMKLLPENSKIRQGKILVSGEDITGYGEKQMRRLRSSEFSMVFQDPMTSLNPTIPIGKQMVEAIRKHRKISREEAKGIAVDLMRLVKIDDAKERFYLQPHYFSGGMRQRCVLAMAMASEPRVIFADEPTTALDVTIQAEILHLIRSLKEEKGISFVFISHDLGVVAGVADRIAIMYAGKIVETGTAEEIFYDPRHPYTWGLLGALPDFAKDGKLETIPGVPPTMIDLPRGDAFAVRNKYAMRIDYEEMPPMFKITDTHYAATWLLDRRAPKIIR